MKKLLFFLTLAFAVMGLIVLSVLLENGKGETLPAQQSSFVRQQN